MSSFYEKKECLLCHKIRVFKSGYFGVYQDTMSIVREYIGENCCAACVIKASKAKKGADHHIIQKLYRYAVPSAEERTRVNNLFYIEISNRDNKRTEKKIEQDKKRYRDNVDIMREYGRDYYSKNKEKCRKYGLEYREINKDKIKEYSKAQYEKNKDKNREKNNMAVLEYRTKNKDKVNKQQRERYKKNKDRDREYHNARNRERYHKLKLQKETA